MARMRFSPQVVAKMRKEHDPREKSRYPFNFPPEGPYHPGKPGYGMVASSAPATPTPPPKAPVESLPPPPILDDRIPPTTPPLRGPGGENPTSGPIGMKVNEPLESDPYGGAEESMTYVGSPGNYMVKKRGKR